MEAQNDNTGKKLKKEECSMPLLVQQFENMQVKAKSLLQQATPKRAWQQLTLKRKVEDKFVV